MGDANFKPTSNAEIKKTYADQVAEKIIEALEAGTAPWLKPWSGAELMGMLPQNGKTGSPYNGMNAVYLMAEATAKGFSDPRWVTYNQAEEMGANIKKGEKSTLVQYWKFTDTVDKLDENGEKVLREDGKPEKVTVKLQNPKVFYASVFNAQQCENMPKLEIKDKDFSFNPNETAETILKKSGANIKHIASDRAYYSSKHDEIVLPLKEQFVSENEYYSTALHELGHWTGHESRLDRKLGNEFGSEDYAKEELRAEIGSFMLSAQIGIDFDPGNHFAYIGSWVKALEEDPKEIFRAARDADKIANFVMDLSKEIATEKTYLKVSMQEKDEAKALGARWDKDAKSWYAPEGANLEPFKKFMETTKAQAQTPTQEQSKEAPTPKKEIATEKTYLKVSMQEKDEAKALGARWDKDAKSWYAPEGANLEPLKKFMETTKAQAPSKLIEIANEVLAEHPIKFSDGLLTGVSKDGENYTFEFNDKSSAVGAERNWISKSEMVEKFNASLQEMGVDKVLGISADIYKEDVATLGTQDEPEHPKVNIENLNGIRKLTTDEAIELVTKYGTAQAQSSFTKSVDTEVDYNGRSYMVHETNHSGDFYFTIEPRENIIENYFDDPNIIGNGTRSTASRNDFIILGEKVPPPVIDNYHYPTLSEIESLKVGEHDIEIKKYDEYQASLYEHIATEKTYLNVPFSQKDEAKALGARWDKDAKSWFALEGTNLEPFKKFIETSQAPTPTKEQVQTATKENDAIKLSEPQTPQPTQPQHESEAMQPTKLEHKTYLYVDFNQKDEAKALGARWDKEESLWYATQGTDRDKIEKFLPENNTANITGNIGDDAMTSFKMVLETKGFKIDGFPLADGKMHRTQIEGDQSSQKSGMYVIHMDGKPTMHFQNHKTGEKDNVTFKGAEFANGADKKEIAKQYAINKAKGLNRELSTEHLHKETAKKVKQEFKVSSPAPKDHPYLIAKSIQAHNTKIDRYNNLQVPFYNPKGEQTTTQRISPMLLDKEGNKVPKRFEKGGEKAGNFAILGASSVDELYTKISQSNKSVIVCEGFATGASIQEATGLPVIVAGDSGNMKNVVENLSKELEGKLEAVLIACDNDKAGINGGEKAKEVLDQVGIASKLITPKFGTNDISSGLSDFNDLAKSKGLDKVTTQITTQHKQLLSEVVQKDRPLAHQQTQTNSNAREMSR